MPAAAASPFLCFLISFLQHVSSPEEEYNGDPEFSLAFNKEAVLLFIVNKLSGKQKAEALRFASHCLRAGKSYPTCCTGGNRGSEKGWGSPKVTQCIFLALISFSFHNFVLSAKL